MKGTVQQTIIHELKGGTFYFNSSSNKIIFINGYTQIPYRDIPSIYTDICDCRGTGNYCNGRIKFEFTYKLN